MILRISVFGLLLVALALPARGDELDPEPPLKTKFYKSPEAVFEASMAATKKQDYKTAVDCIAPSAHKEMAATLAFMALAFKGLGDKGGFDGKQFKPMFDVMDRHGLTEKATKDISTTDQKAAVKALTGLIKKPTAFAIDMTAAQYKMAGGLGGLADLKIEYKLTDVKIKGDKATATVTMAFSGTTVKQPMDFVKVRGGWKMLPDFKAAVVAPAPPPVIEKEVKGQR